MPRTHSKTVAAILQIVIAILLLGIAVGAYLVWNHLTTHRVTIRNDAERDLVDVNIAIYGFGGDLLRHRHIAELRPGDSVSSSIKYDNPEVHIDFTLGGQQHTEEVYMDLWTGEDWLVTINDRGEVESRYDD